MGYNRLGLLGETTVVARCVQFLKRVLRPLNITLNVSADHFVLTLVPVREGEPKFCDSRLLIAMFLTFSSYARGYALVGAEAQPTTPYLYIGAKRQHKAQKYSWHR